MEALHDVVRAGKARYLAPRRCTPGSSPRCSTPPSGTAGRRFVSMQNHYNLIYREEEREMLPLCQDQGVGVIPWSPLARGRLTRPWDTETARVRDRRVRQRPFTATRTATVVEKVLAVADAAACRPAQVGLAWLLAQPAVTSPIVGRHAARAPH